MHLFVYGINSKYAPIGDVLRLVSNYEDIFELFEKSFAPLKRRFPKAEAAIVSTCLRYEALVSAGDGDEGARAEKFILSGLKRYFSRIIKKHCVAAEKLFFSSGENALEHLYSVMSGFESEDIGEIQVLGQIKDGYMRCRKTGLTGPVIDEIYEAGLKCVAKVRSMVPAFTDLNVIKKSVLKKLGERLGEGGIASAKALVAGGGALAGKLGRALAELGAKVKIAREPADAADEELKNYGIIIFVTAAIGFRVDAGELANAPRKLIIFDLSISRSVPPEAAGLENVDLITIDELITVKWKHGEQVAKRRDIGRFYESARKAVAAAAENAARDLAFRFERSPVLSLMNELADAIESEFARSLKGIDEKNYRKRFAGLKTALKKKIPSLVRRRLC